MKATFVRSDNIRSRVSTFYFEAEQPYSYVAGQFVDMTIPHDDADERGISRQFTLSSSPTEPLLAITVKFNGSMSSSFKQALSNLESGTVVHIAQAMGDFVLPLDQRQPLVWIAGGIGITPFRSMAKWLSDTRELRDITLFHITKPSDRNLFSQDFQAAGIAPHATSELNKITAGLLKSVPDLTTPQYYIAGPVQMVERMAAELCQQGVQPYQIVADTFLGYSTT